ncbi:MAG: HNH endonuclease [Balneolales bacterium]
MCRSRVVTASGEMLVDGAHIIPFSESSNNDPHNGLALCKSHHWMYDRYMLSIRADYKIHLSKELDGDNNVLGGAEGLDKQVILLPSEAGLRPAREALELHYGRFRAL